VFYIYIFIYFASSLYSELLFLYFFFRQLVPLYWLSSNSRRLSASHKSKDQLQLAEDKQLLLTVIFTIISLWATNDQF